MAEELTVISCYTRQEAIDDGVLLDVTEQAAEAGFKVPTVVSAGLWRYVEPSKKDEDYGQSIAGRLWDVFMLLRFAIMQKSREDLVAYRVSFVMDGKLEEVDVWAHIGPGDDGEAVLTIMLPEDY